MSVLFPRLLDRAGTALYAEFIDFDGCREFTERCSTRHAGAVFTATGGRRVSETELSTLREGLLDIAVASGFPSRPDGAARSAFDAAVARFLHTTMGLVPAEAAVRSIWAFIALVLAPDVAYWRFPDPPKDRVLATDITRHVFGRLWWRAHLLSDPAAEDPYHLIETFGEAAFDQIFARRRALGGSRALLRGLAEVWPDADTGTHAEREVLRETLKRLLRHGAFQEFESLAPATIREELAAVVAESVVGLESRATSSAEGAAQ